KCFICIIVFMARLLNALLYNYTKNGAEFAYLCVYYCFNCLYYVKILLKMQINKVVKHTPLFTLSQTLLMSLYIKMAGLLGFEPRNDGTKIRCLTAWR